ncbi:uncharacterized protein E0L32_011245 [Thyridium curvatum]|uniref:Probable aspartic-type endopeptidase OPSB n=1 Tax=Thyridium curvatum TaxID=1093900 RepID=A0A507BJQ0_9PEZI|nr:uncharacterized protein E0L32_011245 [Thyridium curvatum]TPX19084.1 hypothetical protein E0L32_011245 [Thyridium curvatum]
MKAVIAVASWLFAATATATNGVVQWDISKRHILNKLVRRAGATLEEVIKNEQTRGGYFATVKVGTPSQELTLQLDTGSSDVWVPSKSANVCAKRTSPTSSNSDGCNFGTFNAANSSTFAVVGQDAFSIAYVDGSRSSGDYFTDVFEIAGAKLNNLTMGLGRKTDIPYGLIGVGYALNEAIVAGTRSASSAYPNLPVEMVNEGLIKTNAYSLWLNDLDSSSGNVLFGGIDTAKYKGNLTRINIYKDPQTNAFTSFQVALTSVTAESTSGNDVLSSQQFPMPVVLDSGTTLSYLPIDLARQIWREAGAVYSPDIGMAVLPCRMANSKGHFTFQFAGPGGPKISVGMDELVLSINGGPAPSFSSGPYRGEDACSFGIQNFSSDPFLLGDTFLRSAYVVYDLVNNEIGIAPTDFNATASNIVAFESLGATIPLATTAPNQAQVTDTPASLTTPGFAAASGFSEGTGGRKNGAPLTRALDWSQGVLVGTLILFSLLF